MISQHNNRSIAHVNRLFAIPLTWIILFVLLSLSAAIFFNRMTEAHTYDPVTALVWNGFYQSDAGVTTSGSEVTAWASQEGGATFSQNVATTYPLLTSSVFNTKAGVNFDGTNDYLLTGSAVWSGTSGYIILYVKTDVSATGVALAETASAASTNYLQFYPNSTYQSVPRIQQLQGDAGGQNSARGQTTTINTGTAYVLEFWSTGTGYGAAINGVAETLAFDAGSNNGDWFGDLATPNQTSMGARILSGSAGVFLNGQLGIVGVIDGSVPSAQERTDLREWVTEHWGVSASPTPTPTATPTPTSTTPTPTSTPVPVTPTVTYDSSCNGTNSVWGWTGTDAFSVCGDLSILQVETGTYSYLILDQQIINNRVPHLFIIYQLSAASENDVFSMSAKTWYDFSYDWTSHIGMSFLDFQGNYIQTYTTQEPHTGSPQEWVLVSNLNRTAPQGTTFVMFWVGADCTSAISCTPYKKTFYDNVIATTGAIADVNTLLTSPGFEQATPTPTPTPNPAPDYCEDLTTLECTAKFFGLDGTAGHILFIILILTTILIVGILTKQSPLLIGVLLLVSIGGWAASTWIPGAVLITVVLIGGVLLLVKIVTSMRGGG